MKKILLYSLLALSFFSSCRNADVDFPDYDFSAVYFAYQSPVRTLVMGNDDNFDTTLDNEHKCKIMATVGGVYENKKNITIDYVVDNDLCNNLYFKSTDGSLKPVKVMPSNYYSVLDEEICLNKKMMGGVEVSFTDEFFNDPASLQNTYVIPLRMTHVVNADSILSGKTDFENPALTNSVKWSIQPKNYVLYCVKYINKWAAKYVRRGVDKITENGVTAEVNRIPENVENGQICEVTTVSLTQSILPWSMKTSAGTSLQCNLVLSFNDNDECTITTDTPGYEVSGTGKFVPQGDKNSWGNKDRDALTLSYTVKAGGVECITEDILAVQTRNIKLEEFTFEYKE